MRSVQAVLNIAGIKIREVSLLAFHGSTWHTGIDDTLKKHFENYVGFCPPIQRYHHHDCHAASTFFPSGFEEALIITVDGSGDGISTQIAVGKKSEIKLIKRFERPQSLGMFYSMITQLCGFTLDADEYKLMGLAAYGDASKFDLNEVLEVGESDYILHETVMAEIVPGQPAPSRYEMLFNQKLNQLTGLNRRHASHIDQPYKDLAAAAQLQLEKALTALVRKYIKVTGISKVCMAGGVALNCLANQKIEALPELKELFIQPASSDAGISLGAAYLASVDSGIKTFEAQTHTFFGNEFSSHETLEILEKCGLKYTKISSAEKSAADLLAQNKVIGWFQGRMEFGPRALGNRSILANPAADDIQQIVNHKIKLREGFRPFGASVLEEDFHQFFEAKCKDSPYMTKVFKVKPQYQKILRGVVHADGTCRVQTVNRQQNKDFYDLISAFKNLSGHGVLLNTSFNLSHEPIVNTPREAIASFFASGMDALYIGKYLVKK
jgi:carbamoyltransferase